MKVTISKITPKYQELVEQYHYIKKPSILQAVKYGKEGFFWRYPPEEQSLFEDTVDNTQYGIAGESIRGYVFHLTYTSPKKAYNFEFEYKGVITHKTFTIFLETLNFRLLNL